ncbi:MAG: haloacid dehalogenase type II [Rubrivivax sp.]|nr:haloacid dehalogenase type II [Rubrivivax sp.]
MIAPAALVFDVFGTVVDWRSSVIAEGRTRGARLGLDVDWAAFADDWRAGYPLAMDEVRRGVLPWTNLDGLHRRILDRLLAERGIVLDEAEAAEFNRVWHRLDPWPDAVEGLTRLKARHPIATLSNGHVRLLLDMARHAGLPWDAIFSAELFGHYKPDPEAYLGACRLLDLPPGQVLMVAAHPSDLRGARAAGLRTAYVPRPLERGPGGPMEPWSEGEFDAVATDFVDLARQLGA